MNSPSQQRLEPDVSRLGDAFRVLSEEMPRLANTDSLAILHLLDELRQSMITKDGLDALLDRKLHPVQERLNSIDSKLQEVSKNDTTRTPLRVEVDQTSPDVKKDSWLAHLPKSEKAANQSPSSTPVAVDSLTKGRQDLMRGTSGAFLVMAVTLLPLFIIMAWF